MARYLLKKKAYPIESFLRGNYRSEAREIKKQDSEVLRVNTNTKNQEEMK